MVARTISLLRPVTERDHMLIAVLLRGVGGRCPGGADAAGGLMRSTYKAETLLPMFRKAADLRNDMLPAGFTDNDGTIHRGIM